MWKPTRILTILIAIALASGSEAQETSTVTLEHNASTSAIQAITTAPAQAPSTETQPQDEPTSVPVKDGVIYQILKPGQGPEAATTQTLVLHYTLTLASNGKYIESSRDQEFPTPLKLMRNQGAFIPGFETGVTGIRLGEVRRIFVPAAQAYGETEMPNVPPNSDLIFTTELVDLK